LDQPANFVASAASLLTSASWTGAALSQRIPGVLAAKLRRLKIGRDRGHRVEPE